MISKFTKMGIATLALAATSLAASAADMPVKGYYKAPPRSVVSYYNWTGFYAGINGGYGWGDASATVTGGAFKTNAKGWLAGATLGYNYQMGSWVWGLEGDIDWANIKGNDQTLCAAAGCDISLRWVGTARGRIGYAFDRWLPYVTGGAAFGDMKFMRPSGGNESHTQLGWAAGAGVEYAFLGNWSAKLEYMHYDLGTAHCSASTCTIDVPYSMPIDTVKAGLNYKFSGPIYSRY